MNIIFKDGSDLFVVILVQIYCAFLPQVNINSSSTYQNFSPQLLEGFQNHLDKLWLLCMHILGLIQDNIKETGKTINMSVLSPRYTVSIEALFHFHIRHFAC